MPLKDFIANKNNTATVTAPKPSGSLASFINAKNQSSSSDPGDFHFDLKTPTDVRSSSPQIYQEQGISTGDTFRWIGKQLMKPQGVAVKELKAVGTGLGEFIKKFKKTGSIGEGVKAGGGQFLKTQKEALDVVIGKEQTSYSQEIKKAQGDRYGNSRIDKAFAIGGDFLIDPLWITKPIKAVQALGKVTRLEKPARALAEVIKEAPAAKKLRTLFSNTTGNKAFDEVVTKFRNLYNYRESGLIDDAVKLQKDIKKYGAGAEEIITEGLENPTSLKSVSNSNLINTVENLRQVYQNLLTRAREVGLKVGEIADYAPHIRTKTSFANTIKKEFGLGAKVWGKSSIEKGRKLEGTIKELAEKGIDIFEKNPAIQMAKKGQMYVKAITSKEFANAVEKFAIPDGVAVSNTLLKGLKFAPEQAKVIDNFYSGVKPEELKIVIKSFDKIQNWWKAQALISPSYHIRNIAGNLWNNFLAGIGPENYLRATQVQKNPEKYVNVIEEMKKLDVINEGWYAADIGEEVINKVKGIGNWQKGLNPLSQENYLFQLNKKAGSVAENNARIAHYLGMRQKGMSAEQAAESVKKYLFDYNDLTSFEKNILKRVIPFYTWTRKNLPLQLSQLIQQPAKFVLPHKIVKEIEDGVEQPNEKYMSAYIKDNIPVRMRKNDDGNTEYFLLGSWLPYASAINLLSRPLDNLIGMVTPMIKSPYEYFSNKSTFFENTLGEGSPIERRYKQQGEFLGMSMRNKNIQLLRNIRILNDMNKLLDKKDPTATKDSWAVKLPSVLFGKSQTYDINKSKYFYDLDTQDRVDEYKKAINDARKKGYSEKVETLQNELNEFLKERNNE